MTASAPVSPIPDQSFRQEYPFASHWLEVRDGLHLHYIDEGNSLEKGAGDPLLFVHGNPSWSFAWRKLIAQFSPTHRCVAVDHIGCGLSSKSSTAGYRLNDHIERLCQLIEHLDLNRITLVAHDWGGAIGMGAATRLQERFSRLVLMNTAAFRSQDIPFRIAICRIPGLGAVGLRGLNLFARAALSQAVNRQPALSGIARSGMIAPYYDWNSRRAVHEFVRDIPLMPDHPSYQTLLEIEQGLKQFDDRPILLPWGMKDWCFHPGFLKRFEEFWPHAQSHPISDAGHYLFEDAPEELGALIDQFLKAH